MREVFPCVSIESKKPEEPQRLVAKDMVAGYVYECVDCAHNISVSSILKGDLVLVLEGSGQKFNMLYNLRNQAIYEGTAEILFYVARPDITEIKLSIPTTIPF
jgi:hypothetical protein